MTPAVRVAAGLAASTLLLALYAGFDAAWPLGFVALVPWLLVLPRAATWRATLLQGVAMAMLFTVAAFWWFGLAIGAYLEIPSALAMLSLLLLAPVLQPQLIAFALAHHFAGRRYGAVVQTLAAVSAWLATEAFWPKLLGDTLAHGLHGVDALRASAAFGGAAGLTVMLLLVNAAMAASISRCAAVAHGSVGVGRLRSAFVRWRAWATPLGLATGLVAVTAAYGISRLHTLETAAAQAPEAAPPAVLRVAMVQASLVDYERRRREQGAYAVVREVLDTHFALSASAVRDHGADALLWSETVYPTTFGQPKSADGAAFDVEIQTFVDAMGAPLLFGTYERDALGEYNAAVLLEPGRGRLASYRKTHPFPFTERVPPWLDGPALRRLLPWTGSWLAGDGARVLPLRSRDGREVQVLPLICLDDVHPQLAIDGARLGAQAIVGMSNDAWFTAYPRGARLHLAVAAFRSAETGLPQLRVTTNGTSAVIDESGEVLVHTQMGQQAALTGYLVARDPLPTPMMRFGDWVGRVALSFLVALALWSMLRRAVTGQGRTRDLAAAVAASLGPTQESGVDAAGGVNADEHFRATLLSRGARVASTALRVVAGIGLVWLAIDMATRVGWQVASLAQLRDYALFVLLPLLLAGAIQLRGRCRVRISDAELTLDRPHEQIAIPKASIATVRRWRWPLPSPGVDLVLGSGRRWSLGHAPSWRRAIDHPLLKFGLFPLLPALVAFQLHQRITFGGPFGEWQSFGADAWFTGLAIWWGAWSLGLLLLAAVLRVGVEVFNVAAAVLLAALEPVAARNTTSPQKASRKTGIREASEWFARALFFLGVPAWLAWRLLAA